MNPFVQSLLLSDQTTGSDSSGFTIDQSLRFTGSSSLTRAITTDSAGTTSTFSFWVKLGADDSSDQCIWSYSGSTYFRYSTAQTWTAYGGGAVDCNWTGRARDFSAWYHIVLQGDGNGNSTDNRIWLNGREISTEFNSRDFPGITQGGTTFRIGDDTNGNNHFKGYLAEFICVNASAVAPTEFGETNSDGVWVPKEYEGTYGSKGFHLKFDSAGFNGSGGIGADHSGNGNDFTANGFTTADVNDYLSDFTATTGSFVTDKGLAFDGLTGTRCFGDANGTFQFAPDPAIAFDSLRIFSVGGTTTFFNWDGNTTTANTASGDWRALDTGGSGGSISAAKPLTITSSGGGRPEMNALEVTVGGVATIITSTLDNDIDYRDTPTSNYGVLNPNQTASIAPIETNLSTPDSSACTTADRYPIMEVSQNFLVEMFDQTPSAGIGNPGVLNLINESTNHRHTISPGLYDPNEIGLAVDIENRATYAYNLATGAWMNGSTGVTNANINSGSTQAQVTWTTAQLPTADRYLLEATGNQGSVNTSANRYNFGQRPYSMPQPSGFVSIQTQNMATAPIKEGNKHFGILTYSAPASPSYPITIDGSGGNNGTGELDFGQSPDLVWIKMTNGSENHIVFDTIRGPGNSLRPDENIAQNTTRTNFAFANNGFTFSAAQSEVYQQNDSYVGWCWKAGGAPTVRNTAAAGAAQDAGSVKVDGANGSFAQGTIGINSMTVNTTGGFSIVQYTGTGAIGTFPHGLGATPEFAIFKAISVNTTDWDCYHVGIGNSRVLKLDQDVTQSAEGVAYYNRTDPTDTLFTLGAGGENNTLNREMIAYLWAPKPGYSKFGRYTGVDLTDGNFIHLGFKPRYLMIKGITQGWSWMIWDTSRNTSNPSTQILKADLADSQSTASSTAVIIDILSNGFKLRNAGQMNQASDYAYIAFAEHPFGGDNISPLVAQ